MGWPAFLMFFIVVAILLLGYPVAFTLAMSAAGECCCYPRRVLELRVFTP